MLYKISKSLNKWALKGILISAVMIILAGCISSGSSGTGSGAGDAGSEDKTITELTSSVIEETGSVKIEILGNSNLTYTSLKQLIPLSIVLYFPGTKLGEIDTEYSAIGDSVSAVKISQQDHASGYDSRVKILLNKDVVYEVSRIANGLELVLSSSEQADENGVDSVAEIDANKENDEGELIVDDSADEVIEDEIEIAGESLEVVEDETDVADEEFEVVEDETEVAIVEEDIEIQVSSEPAKKVLSVSRKITGEKVDISITADGTITDYTIFTIPQNEKKSARIVCDLKNIEGIKTKGEHIILVDSNGVDKIRYFTYPDKMRIVVDVEEDVLKRFNKKTVNSGLLINIGGSPIIDSTEGAELIEEEVELNEEDEAAVAGSDLDSDLDEVVKPEEDAEIILDDTETETAVAVVEETVNDDVDSLEEEAELDEELVITDESQAEPVEDMMVEDSEIDEEVVVQEETESEEEDVAVVEKDIETEKAVAPVKGKAAWVNRIDFSSESGGKSSIVIGTSHLVEYKENKKDDNTIHFRLYNTRLPKSRKLPFITTRFDSAVNRILPVQTDAMKNNALFIIELRESVPYFVDQQGSTLTIHFEPSSIPAQEEDKAGLPEWQEVLSNTAEIPMIEAEAAGEIAEESDLPEEDMVVAETEGESDESIETTSESKTVDSEETTAKEQASADEEIEIAEEDEVSAEGKDIAPDEEMDTGYVSWAHKKEYTGEKISVDFYETDIKNVLRIIRAVSGENFAIDKDVKGKATMTLDNPVPWDQVLDLVLKMNMLGMISEGGINRIATLETLRMEEEKRLEYIAAEEKTRKKKKALEPLVTKYILVNYADAQSEIQPLVKNILTEGRGDVSVDDRTNQLIITDTEEKIQEVLELIKKLDRITPQVIIEARIVEASTSFSRSIGTEWGVKSNQNYDAYSDALGGTYGWDVAMNNRVSSDSSFGINFTKLTGAQFMLNAALLAMETKGEGKIISAPKLITLDNKKATITQGYNYPYTTSAESSLVTQTKFVAVQLKLEVTPHVTSDKKISLQISIDKDDLAAFVGNVPSITTNNIKTELLIDDGDTIVIGGVVKSNKTTTINGFPILSKIPVVGWLFKSKVASEEKQELLIFLTPRIVSFAGGL